MDIIEIDGGAAATCGQILRTSLALSALMRKPVRVYNIGTSGDSPGLSPQLIFCATAVARVTEGEVSGAAPGSTEVVFKPGQIKRAGRSFDLLETMPGACSAPLVFQTLLPILSFAPERTELTIRGATHLQYTPSTEYIEEVYLPSASAMGVEAEIYSTTRGYYRDGEGEVRSTIMPVKKPLRALRVTRRGPLVRLRVYSAVSNMALSTATRQLDRAVARLERLGFVLEVKKKEAPSLSKGSSVFIIAEYENTSAGFCALGAPGTEPESVADEAADRFLSYFHKSGALDPHLADQMALFMALASGESRVTVSEVTGHLTSAVRVIEEFLPVKFAVEGVQGAQGALGVVGCASRPRNLPRRYT